MLSIAIFVPIVAAVGLLALPRGRPQLARWVALAVSVVPLAVVVVAWARFEGGPGFELVEDPFNRSVLSGGDRWVVPAPNGIDCPAVHCLNGVSRRPAGPGSSVLRDISLPRGCLARPVLVARPHPVLRLF